MRNAALDPQIPFKDDGTVSMREAALTIQRNWRRRAKWKRILDLFAFWSTMAITSAFGTSSRCGES
jgi:hypothetical protein